MMHEPIVNAVVMILQQHFHFRFNKSSYNNPAV
jgi:hypothetical protein